MLILTFSFIFMFLVDLSSAFPDVADYVINETVFTRTDNLRRTPRRGENRLNKDGKPDTSQIS